MREPKRHTARHVASARGVPTLARDTNLAWGGVVPGWGYLPWTGGYLPWTGGYLPWDTPILTWPGWTYLGRGTHLRVHPHPDLARGNLPWPRGYLPWGTPIWPGCWDLPYPGGGVPPLGHSPSWPGQGQGNLPWPGQYLPWGTPVLTWLGGPTLAGVPTLGYTPILSWLGGPTLARGVPTLGYPPCRQTNWRLCKHYLPVVLCTRAVMMSLRKYFI